MSSVNRVLIMGTLGQTPTLKTTRNGKPYCRISVATNSWREDAEGKSRTDWHSVHVFGKQAESAAQYLEKGRQVFVEGSLENSKFEDGEGKTQYQTFITANRVTFLGSRRSESPAESLADEDFGGIPH